VTHLRCGGKYDTSLDANLLLSPTVKEFLKSANISQSYERISSGTFFMAHGVIAYHCSVAVTCANLIFRLITKRNRLMNLLTLYNIVS